MRVIWSQSLGTVLDASPTSPSVRRHHVRFPMLPDGASRRSLPLWGKGRRQSRAPPVPRPCRALGSVSTVALSSRQALIIPTLFGALLRIFLGALLRIFLRSPCREIAGSSETRLVCDELPYAYGEYHHCQSPSDVKRKRPRRRAIPIQLRATLSVTPSALARAA